MKSLDFTTKEMLQEIAKQCFQYKSGLYSFFDSCKIPRTFYHSHKDLYKYQIMWIVLEEIEKQQNWELLDNIVSNVYRYKITKRMELKDPKRATELLEEFCTYIWDDPIEKELEKRKIEEVHKKYIESVEEIKRKTKKMEELKKHFMELSQNIWTQGGGYNLEKILGDLLLLEMIEYCPPYKCKGEQIDWSIKFDQIDYLIETKATKGIVKQSDFAIFDWKIEGKWHGTRGIFVSLAGFDENAIQKYSQNSPRIICIDGQDIYLCLEGRYTMFDLLQHKTDILARKWEIFSKISNIR